MENLTCKMFYWTLISTKYKEPQCKTKWAEYFPLFKKADDSVWTRIFEMPFKNARETNLQSFQYRVIHRIIPCNKWLHNITVKSSSLCDFCENEDNLIHYFMHCSNTKIFWNYFFNWWHTITEMLIENILDEHILFGFPSNCDIVTVLNFCVLFAKWYIYCKKLNNNNDFDLYEYQVQLKQRLLFEKNDM